MGCLKINNFPAKMVQALLIHMRQLFFSIHSVSNNCSNMANFPVKRLKKIRMRRIFFFLSRFNDLQLAL